MHNFFFYIKSFFIGKFVGKDSVGNSYYTHKKDSKIRWVIYKGMPEATKVSPEWFGWLHGTLDEPLPYKLTHYPNLTGTPFAHVPKDTTESAKHRTDYTPWKP